MTSSGKVLLDRGEAGATGRARGQILKLLSLWNGRQMWNLNISLEGENGIVSGRVSRKVLAGDRLSSGSYCETPGLRGAALLPVLTLCLIISRVRRTQGSSKRESVQAPSVASTSAHCQWNHDSINPGSLFLGNFLNFLSPVFLICKMIILTSQCCAIKWNNMYYIFYQSNTHTASLYAKMFSEIWGCIPGSI